MFNSLRSLRSPLTAALLALPLLAAAPRPASAVTLQVPHDLGLTKTEEKPYNFTGRVFALDDSFTAAFGSATLIRRHTALTAGHVVYDPAVGFVSRASWSRALYENTILDQVQVAAVNVLSGYQTVVATYGQDSYEAFARDMGYLLFDTPPIDNDWGVYTTNSSLLTLPTTGFFVLGYPGITFDGLTMAYIVPMQPYVQIGTGDTGSYQNTAYTAEEGMSGGPVYVVPNYVADGTAQTQIIAGETVGGLTDSSGEFNFSIIRGIDKEAGKFLAAAEYTSGLIKKVKIKGPLTVNKGTTVTYTTSIKFSTPSRNGAAPTTDRYSEITLKSNNAGTAVTDPVITIKKINNTTFQVTFDKSIRSGTTATLTPYYNKTTVASNTKGGDDSITVKIQ